MSTQDAKAAKRSSKQPPPQIKDPSVPPGKDDGLDSARIQLVRERWDSQDIYVLERDRQVEQHARMLMGDQWSVWSPLAGTFINVSEALGLPELLWRELPRVNKLADWYDMTVARLTENPPVLGAMPRDADRASSLLANASDVLLPKLWDDLKMTDRNFEMVGWLAVAGWAFLKSYPDYNGGDYMQGPAVFQSPMDPTMQVPVEQAYLGADGTPQGQVVPQPDGSHEYDPTGAQPGKEGQLCCHVLSPLECRGEWGSAPWQQKQWHIHRTLLTPEQFKQHYGIDAKPDATVYGGNAAQYYRVRLERGPGHYGATDLSGYGFGQDGYGPPVELVTVDEMWERPSPMFPAGRLLIVTPNLVVHDGERPFPKLADYGLTSPITYVEWQRVPSRPFGTTPFERGVPIQRQINMGARQILLHRAKCTNPPLILNTAYGLTEEDAQQRNQPGSVIPMELPPGVAVNQVAGYLEPGQLGADAWKAQEWLEQQFNIIMDLEGSGGVPQTGDASGEQVKELRFNSDRPISVPVRHMARALEEQGDIWYCILPTIWSTEKTIAYTGEDNAARTLSLLPEMWDGKVKIDIDAESMMPRSRQEREAQALRDYQLGLYGQPMTSDAIQRFFKQARYPNLDDADLPGGVDVATAKQLMNAIRQGTPAEAIPMIEQWNYTVIQATLRETMAAPEYLSYPPPIQAQLQMLWQRLLQAEQMQAWQQAMRQTRVAAGVAQIQAPLAQAAATLHGQMAEAATPPEPDQSASPSGSGD